MQRYRKIAERQLDENQKDKVMLWLAKDNLSAADVDAGIALMMEFEKIFAQTKMPDDFPLYLSKMLFQFCFANRITKPNEFISVITSVLVNKTFLYLFADKNKDGEKIIQLFTSISCLGSARMQQIRSVIENGAENNASLDMLIEKVEEISCKHKTPEQSPQEVYRQFNKQSEHVSILLPEQEQAIIFQQYDEILKYKTNQLSRLSSTKLKEIIADLNKKKHNWSSQETVALLAVGCEVMQRELSIAPYHKQVLVVLGLLSHSKELQGRLVQDQTGEGKTTVAALLALLLAFQEGPPVDVIAPNKHLAMHAQQKYKNFFKWFDLTSCHMCTDNISEEQCRARIAYGRNTDFQFSYLRYKLKHQTHDRPRGYAIADEADYLLVDSATNSARITANAAQDQLHEQDIVIEIFDSVKAIVGKEDSLSLKSKKLIFLKKLLREKFGDEPRLIAFDQLLDKYFHNAIKALFEFKEEDDYIIKEEITYQNGKEVLLKCIRPVEKNTGEDSSCRWSDGLHTFLELKHRLPLKAELPLAAAISNPRFFNLYTGGIYGLSGTLNGLEHTMREMYNIDIFHAPTRLPKKTKKYPPKYHHSLESYYNDICVTAMELHNSGRAVLIVVNSIKNSKTLAEKIKKEAVVPQLYNALYADSAEKIAVLAGQPGSITVATIIAGRGYDIPIREIVNNAGGLHVICGFLPANARIGRQVEGRGGRNGADGSSQVIIPPDDARLKQCIRFGFVLPTTGATQNIDFDLLYFLRDKLSEKYLVYQKRMIKREEIVFELMNDVFNLFQQWNEFISDDFLIEAANQLYTSVDDLKSLKTTELSKPLRDQLNHIMTAHLSTAVFLDWLKAVREHFADTIRKQWIHFYSNLLNDINDEVELVAFECHVKSKYRKFITTLPGRKKDPRIYFIQQLQEMPKNYENMPLFRIYHWQWLISSNCVYSSFLKTDKSDFLPAIKKVTALDVELFLDQLQNAAKQNAELLLYSGQIFSAFMSELTENVQSNVSLPVRLKCQALLSHERVSRQFEFRLMFFISSLENCNLPDKNIKRLISILLKLRNQAPIFRSEMKIESIAELKNKIGGLLGKFFPAPHAVDENRLADVANDYLENEINNFREKFVKNNDFNEHQELFYEAPHFVGSGRYKIRQQVLGSLRESAILSAYKAQKDLSTLPTVEHICFRHGVITPGRYHDCSQHSTMTFTITRDTNDGIPNIRSNDGVQIPIDDIYTEGHTLGAGDARLKRALKSYIEDISQNLSVSSEGNHFEGLFVNPVVAGDAIIFSSNKNLAPLKISVDHIQKLIEKAKIKNRLEKIKSAGLAANIIEYSFSCYTSGDYKLMLNFGCKSEKNEPIKVYKEGVLACIDESSMLSLASVAFVENEDWHLYYYPSPISAESVEYKLGKFKAWVTDNSSSWKAYWQNRSILVFKTKENKWMVAGYSDSIRDKHGDFASTCLDENNTAHQPLIRFLNANANFLKKYAAAVPVTFDKMSYFKHSDPDDPEIKVYLTSFSIGRNSSIQFTEHDGEIRAELIRLAKSVIGVSGYYRTLNSHTLNEFLLTELYYQEGTLPGKDAIKLNGLLIPGKSCARSLNIFDEIFRFYAPHSSGLRFGAGLLNRLEKQSYLKTFVYDYQTDENFTQLQFYDGKDSEALDKILYDDYKRSMSHIDGRSLLEKISKRYVKLGAALHLATGKDLFSIATHLNYHTIPHPNKLQRLWEKDPVVLLVFLRLLKDPALLAFLKIREEAVFQQYDSVQFKSTLYSLLKYDTYQLKEIIASVGLKEKRLLPASLNNGQNMHSFMQLNGSQSWQEMTKAQLDQITEEGLQELMQLPLSSIIDILCSTADVAPKPAASLRNVGLFDGANVPFQQEDEAIHESIKQYNA